MVDSQIRIEKAQSLPSYSRWGAVKVNARKKVVTAVERLSSSPRSASRPSGDEPVVLVGPVIGLVEQTSARILLEIDKTATVKMTLQQELEPESSIGRRASGSFSWRGSSHKSQKSSLDTSVEGNVQTQEQTLQAKRASIFKFEQLTPGTRYAVRVDKCYGAVDQSSFRTFPETPAECFRIGSISCNSIFITKKTITGISDLWAHLLTRTRGAEQMDLLVHLGDQIYGDGDRHLDAGAGKDRDKWSNRFKIAKDILKDVPKDRWKSKQDEICEKYRDVYRETWKHPETAKCLARCPNLMIYDDHEIRDNWGDNPSDQDRESVDFFIARCAWIVNLEYQRQLHEDVDTSKLEEIEKIKKDHHFHLIGNIGFMFLDIRGSRTFHREQGEKIYLGSKQWEDIREALKDDGKFKEAKVLVVCSPAPLVFLVPSITIAAGGTVHRLEDFKGHWSAHKKEQVNMIKCLHDWKVRATDREVLVLGGDVHCGGHSRILKSRKVLFYQLTTSPMANMPLPKSVYYVMRFAEQLGGISEDYEFSHFNWTRARNYGVVQITFPKEQDDGKTEIIMQLVRGKFMRPIRIGKRVSNLQDNLSDGCKPHVAFAISKQKLFSVALNIQKAILFCSSRRSNETVK